MEYRSLGRTGVQVSALCLGCWMFGDRTGAEEARAIVDAAIEAGINFFDTSNIYGGAPGRSEQILGDAVRASGRRNRLIIATKVFFPTDPDDPNGRGVSRRHILASCEQSLRRLQTDYIDVYQMHHVDRDTPWEEIWQAMETLVQEGKVIYIGSSNFAGWHIAQANEVAKDRHFLGLVSEQCLYNLVQRTVEMEVLPACRSYGMGVIPYSPLGGGLLGGVLQGASEGRRASESVQQRIEEHRSQLEQYESLCADLGEKPADVALAWLLAQPDVTAPIVGPRTAEQFEGNMHAIEIDLSEDALQRLDQIFPGPGGPAPEAFAW
jgi:aryl-alcohol dehydrogenase-like predicted oxidoreductase